MLHAFSYLNCSYEYGKVSRASGKETMRKQSKHGMRSGICLVASCAVLTHSVCCPSYGCLWGPARNYIILYEVFSSCFVHNTIT